jgi:hypothetical protein
LKNSATFILRRNFDPILYFILQLQLILFAAWKDQEVRIGRCGVDKISANADLINPWPVNVNWLHDLQLKLVLKKITQTHVPLILESPAELNKIKPSHTHARYFFVHTFFTLDYALQCVLFVIKILVFIAVYSCG